MPSDDYAPVGGGALRIKGAKVKKHKKSSTKKKTDLEKNLSTSGSSKSKKEENDDGDENHPDHDKQEAKDEKEGGQGQEDFPGEERKQQSERRKTDAERRFEEARRKKLLELAESANSRPELLKTHKERVEELNTYLSKLSEHHDMPKIGPG